MTWADFKKAIFALVIWREAQGEGREGMRAVAHVVANRVASHQGDWLDVIERRWQFSSISAPGDGELTDWPKPDGSAKAQAFEVAMGVADLVMGGSDPDLTNGALFYANLSVLAPDNNFIKNIVNQPATHPLTVKVGAHSFYR